MLKILLSIVAALTACGMWARPVDTYHVSDITVERSEDAVSLAMTVNPSLYRLKFNSLVEITPCLVSADGTSERTLKSMRIAGKNAYYYALRDEAQDGLLFRSGKGDDYRYSVTFPYEPWMESTRLMFRVSEVSCCGGSSPEPVSVPIAIVDCAPPAFMPVFEFVPVASSGEKTRVISGRAFVNFPVNRTEIYSYYMNNTAELRKITDTIDRVKSDADISVDTIRLTGYASPEGSYDNNARLATGRTEALKSYVMKQYDFPRGVWFTASVPEDWAGLREYVALGATADSDGILALIDDASIPVRKKNDVLKQRFPRAYAELLKNVYPMLRHTDYYIHYTVRHYTTLDEIRAAYSKNPSNLDLGEFCRLAASYPVGSKEYVDIMEAAAMLNPANEAANLNAAGAMMMVGDMKRAERYLAKAGNSHEAVYSRGVSAALQGNYTDAERLFTEALGMGSAKAAAALENLRNIRKYKSGRVALVD